jgi:hypothetical protein
MFIRGSFLFVVFLLAAVSLHAAPARWVAHFDGGHVTFHERGPNGEPATFEVIEYRNGETVFEIREFHEMNFGSRAYLINGVAMNNGVAGDRRISVEIDYRGAFKLFLDGRLTAMGFVRDCEGMLTKPYWKSQR